MSAPANPTNQDGKSVDKILRTLADHFFQDFVEILFPDVAGDIDFSSVQPVAEELFADFQKHGHVRPDVAAKMWSKDGEPQFALFHGEMEYQKRQVMALRLKGYSQQLSLKYQKEYGDVPILSAVVFVHGGPENGMEACEYVTRFKGLVTNRFYYMALSLSRSLAEDYVDRPQALAAALAAFMRSKLWDRVEQKIRCYEAVQQAELDDEERYLLVNVVDEQLQLNEDDAARFEAEVGREERQEVAKMAQTYSEALADREARGEAQGKLAGCRDAIARFAKALHGELPENFQEKLNAIDSLERLHDILELVPKAGSLDEIDLGPPN